MIMSNHLQAETLGIGDVNVKFPTCIWDKRGSCRLAKESTDAPLDFDSSAYYVEFRAVV